MRETVKADSSYFSSFIDSQDNRINHLSSSIKSGETASENLPRANNIIFIASLEKLIANYSKGESIDLLKQQYVTTLNLMTEGWADSVVKFKMGRPQVIYDKYSLNYYCYMVWMLSLAVLFRVSDKEINILKLIIQNGKIDDELILFLLQLNIDKSTETNYKPFKSLLKSDISKTDSNHIKKYLDKWYQNTKLLTWHNYTPENGKLFYYGRWSFESAAVVAILDLDDSKFIDNEYYPKDLVDYYRANQSE